MKRFISFFAVVPTLAMLLTACNAINISDQVEGAILERQNYVSDPGVKVSLAEAYDIAGDFFNSDAGNGLLPTKSADSSTKTISKSATIKEDGQDLMYVFNYDGWCIADDVDSGDGHNYQYIRKDIRVSVPSL